MRQTIALFLLIVWLPILGFSQSLSCGSTPYYWISGLDSGLDRPEGVDFLPDGQHFAVSNSDGDSITFYPVNEPDTPVFVLSGPETKLNYPHDLSFSHDGKWLSVANRTGNYVSIYERSGEDCQFHMAPIALIQNKQFKGVGGTCFSPLDPIIAIASTYSNQIFFYLFNEGTVSKKPTRVLQHPSLSVADGLSFSPDGTRLAVASHLNHKLLIFQRTELRGKIAFSPKPLFILEKEQSELSYPHSATFDKDGTHIIISSAGSIDAASVFAITEDPFSIQVPALDRIKIFDEETHCSLQGINHEECGGKGVAISPDGKILLLCAPNEIGEDGVYFFRIKS